MSYSKDEIDPSMLSVFKERAISFNKDSDEFQNCRSYSQILDVIDSKEKERQM